MEETLCERQESSAQSSTVTVEEIQARIKQCLKEGIGRTHCRCKEPIHPEQIRVYPHEDGLEIKGKGRQWVYIRCPKCGYDWSLWKLGMKLDKTREEIEVPRRQRNADGRGFYPFG